MNKKALLLLLLVVVLFLKPAFAVIGDVNKDGVVDVIDVAMVARAFGSYPGHPRWNPAYDINVDGRVDVTDLAMVEAYFGQHD
jgi:hypothetical protein